MDWRIPCSMHRFHRTPFTHPSWPIKTDSRTIEYSLWNKKELLILGFIMKYATFPLKYYLFNLKSWSFEWKRSNTYPFLPSCSANYFYDFMPAKTILLFLYLTVGERFSVLSILNRNLNANRAKPICFDLVFTPLFK